MHMAAQDCSIPLDTPLFAITEEYDIQYGSGENYDGSSQILRLNLFKPVGDGQTERPMMILIHGGGFFDGHRNDLNFLGRELASMGWAAATVSYRLGFHGNWLFNAPWAYDPAEVIRAAYRAQQDVRGAVRFLKGRHAIDSTSTRNVMLWGYSAGAIAALHAAYVTDPAEKPASCGSIGDVSYIFSSYDRPDLGPYNGTLNQNGYNEEVIGIGSNYGGLLDTVFISSGADPAVYLYHQTGDPIVGCGHQQGLWGMPLGVGDNYPYLYGSCVMDDRMQAFMPLPERYQYYEHVGGDHSVHDNDLIKTEMLSFLHQLFCGERELALKVFLGGPYDPSIGLMNDALRSLPDFPLNDPYPALGYTFVENTPGIVDPSVLQVAGPDAIVDRIVVELRRADAPQQVLQSRSALLQRDGDVVDMDGVSRLSFDGLPLHDYYLSVVHRNHLGIMTSAPIDMSYSLTMVDLGSTTTSTYGSEARKSIAGTHPVMAMWEGDVNFNGELKYIGMGNDRDPILTEIGGSVPTNVVFGYHQADVNLDGVVKYVGTTNDRDPIVVNIGGSVPTNTRNAQLP